MLQHYNGVIALIKIKHQLNKFQEIMHAGKKVIGFWPLETIPLSFSKN